MQNSNIANMSNNRARKRRLRRLNPLRVRRPRVRGLSFNRLIPNILTMLGLCAGLSAIRFGIENRFEEAAIALLVAACIDGLDGRIARLLHATSHFGAEFDSLSDFVCFGVAPSLLLFLWTLQWEGERYGFIPCILFTVCMALRLARFNASLADDDKPAYSANYFTGVPAPAGALIVLFPLFMGLEARRIQSEWLFACAHQPLLSAIMLVMTAALLVSTTPVWSFKNFRIPSRHILPIMLGTVLYATFLISDPWAALALAALVYLLMIPFSRRSFKKLKREAEALSEEVETVI